MWLQSIRREKGSITPTRRLQGCSVFHLAGYAINSVLAIHCHQGFIRLVSETVYGFVRQCMNGWRNSLLPKVVWCQHLHIVVPECRNSARSARLKGVFPDICTFGVWSDRHHEQYLYMAAIPVLLQFVGWQHDTWVWIIVRFA